MSHDGYSEVRPRWRSPAFGPVPPVFCTSCGGGVAHDLEEDPDDVLFCVDCLEKYDPDDPWIDLGEGG